MRGRHQLVDCLGSEPVARRRSLVDAEVGGEHHDAAVAQAVGCLRRLSPAEIGVARDSAQGGFAFLLRTASQQVGHAPFGDDMADIVAMDHHRRQREARGSGEVERVQPFDKARCAVRLMRLHHLHHELASAQALTGFGGAPNMGADARGRRHDTPAWLRAGQEAGESLRGRTLVVQMVQTHQPNGAPSFVERLDAFDLAASAGFALPPVMIYGDDVSHVITERGVANLLRCRSPQEREAALRAVAGDTDFGRRQSPEATDDLRRRGIVMLPSDLGIDDGTATRDWLAAKTIDDLVTASGGLYVPPAKFRRNVGAAA